uniref:VDE lipocalin domain-containing protein n=1 Tax=Eutreptiella gymnastica TaxID=73025 RepID=A0A7S1N7U8_9EUGL|mmetsp:Transcript_133261/g.231146  ORF Transcript_133261/g.231146 Transcript_133261/m.231146 type:complete len:365 (+) Transcript_133261:50-1144(+)
MYLFIMITLWFLEISVSGGENPLEWIVRGALNKEVAQQRKSPTPITVAGCPPSHVDAINFCNAVDTQTLDVGQEPLCQFGCDATLCLRECNDMTGANLRPCYTDQFLMCRAQCAGNRTCEDDCKDKLLTPCLTQRKAACAAECEQQRSMCIKQCLMEFDLLRIDVRLGLVRNLVSGMRIPLVTLTLSGNPLFDPFSFEGDVSVLIMQPDLAVNGSITIWSKANSQLHSVAKIDTRGRVAATVGIMGKGLCAPFSTLPKGINISFTDVAFDEDTLRGMQDLAQGVVTQLVDQLATLYPQPDRQEEKGLRWLVVSVGRRAFISRLTRALSNQIAVQLIHTKLPKYLLELIKDVNSNMPVQKCPAQF